MGAEMHLFSQLQIFLSLQSTSQLLLNHSHNLTKAPFSRSNDYNWSSQIEKAGI